MPCQLYFSVYESTCIQVTLICYSNLSLSLWVDMKNLLKYLLLLIVSGLFWNDAQSDIFSASRENAEHALSGTSGAVSSFSTTDSELALPVQLSFTNAVRAHVSVRRSNGFCRNNIESARFGKLLYIDSRSFISRKHKFMLSSVLTPVDRLIYQGKLII